MINNADTGEMPRFVAFQQGLYLIAGELVCGYSNYKD